MLRLAPGWDGYRGQPVSLENADFTLRMLEAVCGPDTAAPQLVPGPAGDLQIEWHTLKGDIELHVREPGSVHAWCQVAGSQGDGQEQELTVDFSVVATWVKELTEPALAVTTATA